MTETATVADGLAQAVLNDEETEQTGIQPVPWVDVFKNAALKERFSFKDGPLAAEIDEVLRETNRRLASLSPQLRPEHLQPTSYITKEIEYERNAILNARGAWASRAASNIAVDHRKSLARVGIRHATQTPSEILTPGLLETPPFYGSNNSSKCALFCFQMIANALLPPELAVDDYTLFHAVTRTKTSHRVPGDHKVDYDVYAHALTADEFASASGMQTEYVQLRGATLGLIGKIASGIHAKRPDSRIFCTLPLQSDSFEEFWHQVVLTSATDDGVYIHNPGGDKARPNQLINRVRFYKKWAICMNIAHIFISAPRQ